MNARFLRAFDDVLGHALDRAMLLHMLRAGREVRYEELRKSVGSPPSQTFQYSLDRLMDNALVKRRLEPWGERHKTLLSPTASGLKIARVLEGLATKGAIPRGLLDEMGPELKSAFGGSVPA